VETTTSASTVETASSASTASAMDGATFATADVGSGAAGRSGGRVLDWSYGDIVDARSGTGVGVAARRRCTAGGAMEFIAIAARAGAAERVGALPPGDGNSARVPRAQ
jgi:hypothetical protein